MSHAAYQRNWVGEPAVVHDFTVRSVVESFKPVDEGRTVVQFFQDLIHKLAVNTVKCFLLVQTNQNQILTFGCGFVCYVSQA